MWGPLTAATTTGTLANMAPPSDIASPLKMATLAWQLVAGEPPADCTSPVQATAVLTARVGTAMPMPPTAPGHDQNHHQPHVPGSRVFAAAGATTSAAPTKYIVVADATEYVKDAVSDQIVDDLVFVGGQLFRCYRLG